MCISGALGMNGSTASQPCVLFRKGWGHYAEHQECNSRAWESQNGLDWKGMFNALKSSNASSNGVPTTSLGTCSCVSPTSS